MDPFAVLGVTPAASERELAAAYRELAKQWHPDRRGEDGRHRMAEINAAYELLRAGAVHERFSRRPSPPGAAAATGRGPSRQGRRRKGGWLPDAVRRALGPELLDALTDGERVRLVTPAGTWASSRTVLALTDRRLLWLLDDAPVARVRTTQLREVADVAVRVRPLRRRVATLQLKMLNGRRQAFAELRPHTAATLERHIREAIS